jgi:DNA-binding Lrp family transcriptional regulator
MDDTDRKLMLLICANPRIRLRELAKNLGISTQAVHHRIQVLTEIGVIEGMTAGISIHYLHAVPLIIFGRSNTTSVKETLDRLGESEFSSLALAAGGNYFYVIGLLRDISELDGYTEFVKRVGKMPEPTVGIFGLDYPEYRLTTDGGTREQSYKELSPLDLRIIVSLKHDARRSIADIADDVGVSAKTVRRHLDDMTSEGSLEFYVPWDPVAGGNTFMLMHVNLKDSTDKVEVGRKLLSKYPLQIAFIRTFRNIPGFLWCVLSLEKTTQIRKILREIAEDEDVLTVMPNFVYLERNYSTWRDKLPEARTQPPKKAETRNLRPGLRTQ